MGLSLCAVDCVMRKWQRKCGVYSKTLGLGVNIEKFAVEDGRGVLVISEGLDGIKMQSNVRPL